MEKRRWFCRRYCIPGDSCPGSSPLSVGEKVLDSGWGSLPRGPSCRSERGRRQLPTLPLRPGAGGEGKGDCLPPLSAPSHEGWVRQGQGGAGGPLDSSPSLRRLWSWLNCSVNSAKDSSMVSVRGTDRERRRLKFFILFMVRGPGWWGLRWGGRQSG